MYLTEVSPINLRGTLGSIHQLLVTISILVAQILGLPFIWGNEKYWPFIFGMHRGYGSLYHTCLRFSVHRRAMYLPAGRAPVQPRVAEVQPDREEPH